MAHPPVFRPPSGRSFPSHQFPRPVPLTFPYASAPAQPLVATSFQPVQHSQLRRPRPQYPPAIPFPTKCSMTHQAATNFSLACIRLVHLVSPFYSSQAAKLQQGKQ
eukprot:GFKZ01004571.1.p3 GENE.GFKZ01004571.1~~GFKZ01004571.1.p3  ORF type:complete len:106 (+),score=3.86 GFKZ01004571.1:82-399(+)